jgi:hypothetical protein
MSLQEILTKSIAGRIPKGDVPLGAVDDVLQVLRCHLIKEASDLGTLSEGDLDDTLQSVTTIKIRSLARIALKKYINQHTEDSDDDEGSGNKKLVRVQSRRYSNKQAMPSIIQSFVEILTAKYMVNNWLTNREPEDLREDIESISTNVALIAALVMSMTTPLYVGAKEVHLLDDEPLSPYCEVIYAGALASCTIMEAVTVLLCIRNLAVIR